MNSFSEKLAIAVLQSGAVRLNPKKPFLWTSGYYMPIYNDNRLLLGSAANRKLVSDGFAEIIESRQLKFEIVAGTATAGIAPATTLADKLMLPLLYVREGSKLHGLKRKIEGALPAGKQTILVEDLISTGGSALKAIEAIREAGGTIDICLSIFTYGFKEARENFQKASVQNYSLLTFDELLPLATKENYLSKEEKQLLEGWSGNPFQWGEFHGFAVRKEENKEKL